MYGVQILMNVDRVRVCMESVRTVLTASSARVNQAGLAICVIRVSCTNSFLIIACSSFSFGYAVCKNGWNMLYADIDECLSNPCVHGDCLDEINGYTCLCYPGFQGTLCDSGKLDKLM